MLDSTERNASLLVFMNGKLEQFNFEKDEGFRGFNSFVINYATLLATKLIHKAKQQECKEKRLQNYLFDNTRNCVFGENS